MSESLAKKILSELSLKDSDAIGSITVKELDNTVFVSGQVHSRTLTEAEVEGLVREAVGDKDVVISKLLKQGLTVSSPGSFATTEDSTGELDEVEVIYYGLLPANQIVKNNEFKKLNHETLVKIKRAIEVVGFVAPIVLDSSFRVIDGNLRLEAVRKLYGEGTGKKIPVIVINDSGAKADFLRLVLNRSSEFQRWIYQDVDAFVDEWPQLQPVLEPLGFFANKILPNSFFGGTVVEYKLDEYNDQQKMYSQDIGLAAWAEHQRGIIRAEAERKQKEVDRKKRTGEGFTSLFDLIPAEDDLLPTHDIDTILREHTLDQREVAGVITDNYDVKMREKKAEKGQDWQTSRRGSKQKAADKRAEAEAKAAEFIDEDVVITSDDELETDENE